MTSKTYLIIFVAICHYLLLSSARFVKYPNNDADLRAIFKNSFDLQCVYDGPDSDGDFGDWYKDGKPVNDPPEKPGHYDVRRNETSSTLHMRFYVYNDSLVKRWYVKSSKANHPESIACEFNPIKAIPSPQSLRTDREDERIESKEESVRRVEDEPLALQCLVKPPIQAGDGSSALRWEYSDTNNDQDFQPINEDGVQVDGDTLKIGQVKKTHRGYYRCKLNDHSLMVLLRVKDRLAALWPFLGIVGVVLVLVIVILIAEARAKKTTRRPLGNDEDENDHANDPLVRSANRTSDNDTKKRAVRA